MFLGFTQPLTEMASGIFPGRLKAAGAKGCQPYHLHVPILLNSRSLNLLEPSGPVMGFVYLDFIFTFNSAEFHSINNAALYSINNAEF
jgi:hypothetical protein